MGDHLQPWPLCSRPPPFPAFGLARFSSEANLGGAAGPGACEPHSILGRRGTDGAGARIGLTWLSDSDHSSPSSAAHIIPMIPLEEFNQPFEVRRPGKEREPTNYRPLCFLLLCCCCCCSAVGGKGLLCFLPLASLLKRRQRACPHGPLAPFPAAPAAGRPVCLSACPSHGPPNDMMREGKVVQSKAMNYSAAAAASYSCVPKRARSRVASLHCGSSAEAWSRSNKGSRLAWDVRKTFARLPGE